MFFKKIVLSILSIILFLIIFIFLFFLQKPYGCDKEDINCFIEKGTFYKDAYVCSRSSEQDHCFFEVAQKINDPFFCTQISGEGNYTKEQCLEIFNKNITF